MIHEFVHSKNFLKIGYQFQVLTEQAVGATSTKSCSNVRASSNRLESRGYIVGMWLRNASW
jgi:hypothetical protein